MEERGWQNRSTSAMQCLDARFERWSDFIAANLVVDSAMTTMLSAALDSPYEPLRQRARKIEQEESGHWVHATGWVRRLPASTLLASLERVWDDAFTWFGETDDPLLAPLAESAILDTKPDALRQRLCARLEPVLAEANVAAPLLARELPWSRWDATARRLRPL
jgi:1,2-phenylacetyl-CoA epoxidase catalytic subunit